MIQILETTYTMKFTEWELKTIALAVTALDHEMYPGQAPSFEIKDLEPKELQLLREFRSMLDKYIDKSRFV